MLSEQNDVLLHGVSRLVDTDKLKASVSDAEHVASNEGRTRAGQGPGWVVVGWGVEMGSKGQSARDNLTIRHKMAESRATGCLGRSIADTGRCISTRQAVGEAVDALCGWGWYVGAAGR